MRQSEATLTTIVMLAIAVIVTIAFACSSMGCAEHSPEEPIEESIKVESLVRFGPRFPIPGPAGPKILRRLVPRGPPRETSPDHFTQVFTAYLSRPTWISFDGAYLELLRVDGSWRAELLKTPVCGVGRPRGPVGHTYEPGVHTFEIDFEVHALLDEVHDAYIPAHPRRTTNIARVVTADGLESQPFRLPRSTSTMLWDGELVELVAAR